MNKGLIIVFLLLIFAFTSTGCEQSKISVQAPVKDEILISASEDSTPTSMVMSYSSFTGYRSKLIELDQCETCEVSVNINSSSGDLDLLILDDSGQICFEENSLKSGAFSLSLSGSSRYTLKIIASNHVGSFDIKYSFIE